MKDLKIFEPAMCCSTGLCGVSVNPELLRISTTLDALKKHGVVIPRYNLNSAPLEFISDQTINEFINAHGAEGLPAVTLDGKIVLSGRYPTNDEILTWLGLPADWLQEPKKSGGCCCHGEG